ncbi:YccF domain-containing protein [Acidaminobacterium chupaoyuni]
MSTIGNILWFFLAGVWMAIGWFITGVLWCITIIGIPIGVQCFKMAGLVLSPFGREVNYGGGAGSCLLNVLWLIFGGLELALGNLIWGVLFCITIIGIPFGLQCFKLAQLSLWPFGSNVYQKM